MYTFHNTYTASADFQDIVAFHIDMVILADKYDIAGLHKFATDMFSALPLYEASSLETAAKAAYAAAGATVEIRKKIVRSVVLRKGLLSAEEGNPLGQAIKEIGSFALDVACGLAEPMNQKEDAVVRWKCPASNCQYTIMEVRDGSSYPCPMCDMFYPSGDWNLNPVT